MRRAGCRAQGARGYWPSIGGTPSTQSSPYAPPPGVVSICPRVNDAEDIQCFTPGLGAWYHSGNAELATCGEAPARLCCMLAVDGAEGAAEWGAAGCGGCNFVVGLSRDACFAMFRPVAGLRTCEVACAPQAGAAAPP